MISVAKCRYKEKSDSAWEDGLHLFSTERRWFFRNFIIIPLKFKDTTDIIHDVSDYYVLWKEGELSLDSSYKETLEHHEIEYNRKS